MGYLNLRWPLRKERLFCRLRASDIYKKFQKFISIFEILWANDGQIFHMGKKNGVTISCNSLILSVGAKGFEPSTPCSQSRCASRTAPYPEKKDDYSSSSFFRGEGGIRTPGTHCWIRQFSKLLVSATHPPLLGVELRCKSRLFSDTRKRFLSLFLMFLFYALNYNKI